MRWIVKWCTTTGSLLFIWRGSFGYQPILMPGSTYYWWLDEGTPDDDAAPVPRLRHPYPTH